MKLKFAAFALFLGAAMCCSESQATDLLNRMLNRGCCEQASSCCDTPAPTTCCDSGCGLFSRGCGGGLFQGGGCGLFGGGLFNKGCGDCGGCDVAAVDCSTVAERD